MTDEAIVAALGCGQRAATIAKVAGITIGAVHRIARGEARYTRKLTRKPCSVCGKITDGRGGPRLYCQECRGAHFAAQTKATLAVRRAVAKGLIPPAKDRMCVDCGYAAEHYDHRDYSYPLDVQPVCRSCNYKRGAPDNRFFLESIQGVGAPRPAAF